MRSVSDLDLERFLVDDLPPDERERVAAAIADDDGLQAFVAARRSSQQAWRARRVPPPKVTPGLLERLMSTLRGWQALPLAGAAACLGLFLAVAGERTVDDLDPVEDVVRARGDGAGVDVVVQRDGHVFRHQGQPLRPGDAIRLAPGPRVGHVVVVAIDVHGRVAVVVDNGVVGADGWLSGSLILDDSEGAERWVVVTHPDRIDAAAVVRALSHSGAGSGSGRPAMPSVDDDGTLDVVRQALAGEAALRGATVRLVAFEKEPRP